MRLVRPEVVYKRPQLRLAVVCLAQHFADNGVDLLGFTALEQREHTRCVEGETKQCLCDAVVQLACKAQALVMHGSLWGPLGGHAGIAFFLRVFGTSHECLEPPGDLPNGSACCDAHDWIARWSHGVAET